MDGSTRAALTELHIAEYTAMMNSVAIWKTLQYALFPILFGAWLLLGQIFEKLPAWFAAWLAVLVLPIGYLAYENAAIDALHGVLLIERDIRPLEERLVQTDRFWLHEREYRKSQTLGMKMAYGPWPPILCVCVAIGMLIYRRHVEDSLSQGDWVGFAVCILFTLWVGALTLEEKRLQGEIGIAASRKTEWSEATTPSATPTVRPGGGPIH